MAVETRGLTPREVEQWFQDHTDETDPIAETRWGYYDFANGGKFVETSRQEAEAQWRAAHGA